MAKKYNYTKKTGRPTGYSNDIIDKTREYINKCVDEVIGLNKIRVHLPSIEGLAIYLKVNRDTIYEWRKVHEDFSDILDELLSRQAETLLNNGLSGDYNSTIAKLVLAKHNYVDRQEMTGKDGKDLIPEDREKANEAIEMFLNNNKTDATS